MAHLHVSDLAYAHPGGELLFHDVSFRLPAGPARRAWSASTASARRRCCACSPASSRPTPATRTSAGACSTCPRTSAPAAGTVRELLLGRRPRPRAGRRRARCSPPSARWRRATTRPPASRWARRSASGRPRRLRARGPVGRRLPADRAQRARATSATATPSTLSGGERKRLLLDLLFASEANVLLLDEPDNFLDVPAKRELERADRARRRRRSCSSATTASC